MLIPNEELFDPKAFKIDADMVYETVSSSVAPITIIDNFYEDIDAVLEQIDKLPIATVWKQPDNNKKYFDGRKVYSNTMLGTELQFTQDNILVEKVAEIDEYDKTKITFHGLLAVNCFQLTDEFNLEDNYYSIHKDPLVEKDSRAQLAIVIFLNRHYEEGEGMNFYRLEGEEGPDENNLTPKHRVEVVKTIQGRCNRAVLFDSRFLHSQHTPTDQFKKEMRYTQAIFLSLW